MALAPERMAEWLETDGLGGFASGTVAGPRKRRNHALLLVATTPPAGRFVLVNGLDAWVDTEAGSFALSSQGYGPDVVHSDGERRLEAFRAEPGAVPHHGPGPARDFALSLGEAWRASDRQVARRG